jgi:tol-pal system protein YbgF
MQKSHSLRNRLLEAAAFAVLLVAVPAHAASKEIIALQTQVQQLLDMVQRLQSTLDTRFAVIQHLTEQTADNANQMTAAANALQQKIAAQNDATNAKLDAASSQVQSLNDSVDELKSRIAKLDKSIQDLQAQTQNVQSPAASGASAASEAAPAGASSAEAPPANQKPPLKETFQAGVRDLNAARYDVATGEFQDVIHYYPLDEIAGTAHYYLGEIAYRQNKPSEAVKAYNAVLEGFPGNAKAPAAQLHKGLALLQMNRKDAGVHELRALIQRHPQTPEASQARTKLSVMGLKTTQGRPSPSTPRASAPQDEDK